MKIYPRNWKEPSRAKDELSTGQIKQAIKDHIDALGVPQNVCDVVSWAEVEVIKGGKVGIDDLRAKLHAIVVEIQNEWHPTEVVELPVVEEGE